MTRPDAAPAPRPGLARGALWLLAAGALCAALGAWAWSARRSLAEAWLLARVEALGVAPARLRVEEVGLRAIAVRDVALGAAPDATVERVDATWSLASLLADRFEALRVSGVWARARLDTGGLALGALAPLLAPAEGEGEPFALPARWITIRDAAAELETPVGPFALSLLGDAGESPDGALAGELRAEARHANGGGTLEAVLTGTLDDARAALTWRASLDDPVLRLSELRGGGALRLHEGRPSGTLALEPADFALAGASLRAAGRTPSVELHLDPPGELLQVAFTAEGGRIELPGADVGLADLRLRGSRDPAGELAVRLDVAAGDLREDARFAPVDLHAEASGALEALVLRGRAEHRQGAFAVRAEGSADLLAGRAELRFALDPLSFAPDGLQPGRLLPALADVRDTRGRVEARGRAELGEAGPSFSVDAALVDVSFETPLASVTGLYGRVLLQGPAPLTTPGEQLVAMALLDLGLPLTHGEIAWRLRPDRVLDLSRAEWRWAGGRLHTAAELPLDAGSWRVVLRVEALDLAQLLADVDLDGLSGTGTVAGELPLLVTRERVEVEDGRLAAVGPGTLRYVPPAGAPLQAGAASGLDVALGALSDLRYEALSVSLGGDTRGEMHVQVHVKGANPNFQDGRPVELNVNLEARLADLVRAGLASYRVPEAIEERLRDFSERGEP